ncbi:MAG: NAD(P)-binding domain-containing protein [bacterium]|nr:NAD(P)-binding domain-containing protein [bacterium]
MFKKYFDWLQKDVPTGEVERYPEIDATGETSVKGIYVVGDLTGIPLLKLAAENGSEMITRFQEDSKYQESRKSKGDGILDFLVIGAGPAGVAAGLEALKHDYHFKILESSAKFNTIINFPKEKPIYAEPTDFEQQSPLKINDGVKESLLDELHEQIKGKDLPIEEGVNADNIVKQKDHFEIITKQKTYKALRVILATGKSGNARMLKVPGEDRAKVFNRLFDPRDAKGHDVLVVGGGDSALETAIAVAGCAKSVTVSYRKETFSRPKEGNKEKLDQLVNEGKVKLMMASGVKEITDDKVVVTDKNKKEETFNNSMVFVMIGKELPLDFFKKINIKMEGVLSKIDKWMYFALLMFSGVVYFGKAGIGAVLTKTGAAEPASWGTIIAQMFNPVFWGELLMYPFKGGFFETAGKWNWTYSLNGLIGYLCFIAFVVSGIRLLVYFFGHFKNFTATTWKTLKYSYFILVAFLFTYVYFGSTYFGVKLLGKSPGFWYTFLYTTTILMFGLRRIYVKPTKYIKLQTWALILIQAFPLFLLPEIILPAMQKMNMLGGEKGYLLTQVFPGGDFGHAYRLILAWPLNIYGLFADKITTFWLLYTVLFTFGFIPFIVYKWGKGAYCGWICSCGAMGETLGDEYRTKAPHGPVAKKWENAGQWVLAVAFLITGLKLVAVLGGINIPLIHTPRPVFLDVSRMIYTVVVDVIFAGVLGIGVYFFMSGRVWCRFLCPLAALMHIYARFTRYRIFSDKKKCISCNICTKVCHMGIDVMNYANKGIPMNDVECVRCSACVVNCPTEVLYFGSQPKKDLENDFYKTNKVPEFDKSRWGQGLT